MRISGTVRAAGMPLVLAVLAGAGAAGCAIGLTAAAAWLIVRAAEHPPVLHLTVAIVAVRAFGLGRGGLRYAERLAGHDAAFRVLGEIRSRAYLALTRPRLGDRETRAGDLVARFVADMDAAMDVITRFLLPTAVALVVGLGTAGFLATILPAVGLLVAVGVVLAVAGVPLLQSVAARSADRRTAPLRGELTAQVVELVHGAADLLATGAAAERLAAAERVDARLRAAAARSSAVVGLAGALLTLAGGACVWGALALGAGGVGAGRLDPVLLGVLVLTPLAYFDGLTGLPAAAADLARARPALLRVRFLMDQAGGVPDPIAPAPVPTGPYHLRIERARLRWPGADHDAVVDADLDLPPGRRIALVGPSGGGKTTVAAALARFLEPRAGRVLLNGVDLRSLPAAEVRRIVGLVAEDAYIFDSTIADNLRLGRPDATAAELAAAVRAVRLDGWVAGLSAGLDTAVGEGGQRLSGGQRRRLVIARALVAGHPVLILDEPTEHLDPPTAAAITEDLLAAAGDRTVVLITHQPYGLDQVDVIVTVAGGRLGPDPLVQPAGAEWMAGVGEPGGGGRPVVASKVRVGWADRP